MLLLYQPRCVNRNSGVKRRPCPWCWNFVTSNISTRDRGRPRRLSAASGHTRIMCKPVKSHLSTQPCCRCSAAEIQSEPLCLLTEGEVWWGGAAPLCSLLSGPPSGPGGTAFLLRLHAQGQQGFLFLILAAASLHVPHDCIYLFILSAIHIPTYFTFPNFKTIFSFTLLELWMTEAPPPAHVLQFQVKRNKDKEFSPAPVGN